MNKDKLDQLRERFFKEYSGYDEQTLTAFHEVFNYIETNLLQGEAMEPEASNSDVKPVASHTCASGNSIQQLLGRIFLSKGDDTETKYWLEMVDGRARVFWYDEGLIESTSYPEETILDFFHSGQWYLTNNPQSSPPASSGNDIELIEAVKLPDSPVVRIMVKINGYTFKRLYQEGYPVDWTDIDSPHNEARAMPKEREQELESIFKAWMLENKTDEQKLISSNTDSPQINDSSIEP